MKSKFAGKALLDSIIQMDGIMSMNDKDKMLIHSRKEKFMREVNQC